MDDGSQGYLSRKCSSMLICKAIKAKPLSTSSNFGMTCTEKSIFRVTQFCFLVSLSDTQIRVSFDSTHMNRQSFIRRDHTLMPFSLINRPKEKQCFKMVHLLFGALPTIVFTQQQKASFSKSTSMTKSYCFSSNVDRAQKSRCSTQT